MGAYKNKNKGYYWFLTAIEILTGYAIALPVYRKDTNNMTKAVEELQKKFKDRFGHYLSLAQFDDCKEFYKIGVKALLENHSIEYIFFPTVIKKLPWFHRTLKCGNTFQ